MTTEHDTLDISLSSRIKSIFRTLCLDVLDHEVLDGWARYYLSVGDMSLTEVRVSVKQPVRCEVHPRAILSEDISVSLPPYEWNGKSELEDWLEEAIDVGSYVSEVFSGTIDEIETCLVDDHGAPAVLRGDPICTRAETGIPYIIFFTRGDTKLTFRTDLLVAVRENRVCSEAKTRVVHEDSTLGEVVYEGRQRGHDTIPVIMERIAKLLKNTVEKTSTYFISSDDYNAYSYQALIENPGIYGSNVLPFPTPFIPKALIEG